MLPFQFTHMNLTLYFEGYFLSIFLVSLSSAPLNSLARIPLKELEARSRQQQQRERGI